MTWRWGDRFQRRSREIRSGREGVRRMTWTRLAAYCSAGGRRRERSCLRSGHCRERVVDAEKLSDTRLVKGIAGATADHPECSRRLGNRPHRSPEVVAARLSSSRPGRHAVLVVPASSLANRRSIGRVDRVCRDMSPLTVSRCITLPPDEFHDYDAGLRPVALYSAGYPGSARGAATT